jgi:hypothetical protein
MPKARVALSLLAFALLFSNIACVPRSASAPGAGSPPPFGEKRSSNFIVTLTSNPATPVWGVGTFEAKVTDAKGAAITDAQVSFDLDMTNMHMGKNLVAAASQGEGHYAGRVRFSMPGPWRVIVRIAVPGQASEDLSYEFNVRNR